MMNVFRKEFAISSYDLDPKGQARLTTMANFFQEVAYHHASKLGLGYDEMKSRKTTWVLSRMRIQMKRYPVWNEQFTMETWPSGAEKLFALRDFRVLDRKGNVIGRASTAWLILDIDTHRLIRPKEMMDRFKMIIQNSQVFDRPLGRIDIPGQIRQLSGHRVLFSDLDIVGHVNNVKYMEWCLDVATDEGNIQQDLLELEINFNHEALFGDLIRLGGSEVEGNYYFIAIREGDGQEIFRARLQRNS
jgi:medium-chain acyl-[acyl-carrier-protein] hydrolase